MIQQVKVHVDRYRRLTLPQRGRIAKVIVEHEAVLTAIEAHDAEGARRAMEVHLESLLDNISATQTYQSGVLRRDEAVQRHRFGRKSRIRSIALGAS